MAATRPTSTSTSSLPMAASQALPPAHTSSGKSAATTDPGPVSGLRRLPFPSEPPPLDTLSGPHRDGRIRNPVPSKLKGKTDGSKGNFGVMQIEVAGRTEATDRDAEAKRTSESTELAAKRAFENGYVSLRRSRFVHLPEDPVAKPYVPAAAPASVLTDPVRRLPLGPEETKSEQARLLTLLRSLHPVLVVDQICKALAFFGGIPGALPPANGEFPESAEANGSGSLFVGWIAEIFPKLGGNSGQQSMDPTRQLDNPQPVKRKRGRPKGSKATKARRDKGSKKGPSKARPNTAPCQPSDVPDESWVDVDDSGLAATDHVSPDVILLVHATSPPAQSGRPRPDELPQTPTQTANAAARTTLPAAAAANGAATGGLSSARRRGRPVGSKNRPKSSADTSAQARDEVLQTETERSRKGHVSPQGALVPPTASTSQSRAGVAGPQSFTAGIAASRASPKKKVGRARGAGPKQQSQPQDGQVSTNSEQRGRIGITGPSDVLPSAQFPVPAPQQSQRNHDSHPQGLTLPTPPTASPNNAKQSIGAGHKRKRKGGGAVEAGVSGPNSVQEGSGRALPTPPSIPKPSPLIVAPEPSAKRQRKSREARSSAKSGSEVAATGIAASVAISTAGALPFDAVPNAVPRSGPAAQPAVARQPELVRSSAPVVEPAMPVVHSTQDAQFEEQPTAMETYEAQLQVQFAQQPDAEPQAVATQGAPGGSHSMTARLAQQPLATTQQQRYVPQHHHRQQQQQLKQHQNQHHASVANGRSPSLQPQLTNSSLVAQQQQQEQLQQQQQQQEQPQQQQQQQQQKQQARNAHNHYSQYRLQASQYRHHQQQSYVSPQMEQSHQQQHQQQQFPGDQPPSAQLAKPQQYSASVSQPQQYASHQQPYGASQQSYSSGQQQKLSSQQRYPQHQPTTSGTGAASFTTHQSPRFGSSTGSNLSSADAGYRNPAAQLNNSPYDQRSQSVTPSSATSLRTASTHETPQPSQQYGPGSTSLQQRSAGSSQPASQGMQTLANVQAFTGHTAADWGLFDTSHLDATGQQGTMALNSANYGIGAASVRASSNSDAGFAATGLTTFDPSTLGGADRFYGVGRR